MSLKKTNFTNLFSSKRKRTKNTTKINFQFHFKLLPLLKKIAERLFSFCFIKDH